MTKKKIINTCIVGLSSAVLFVSGAVAEGNGNCKKEVDKANAAQSARDRACEKASKPMREKTVKEMKEGDSQCRERAREYGEAKKELRECTDK